MRLLFDASVRILYRRGDGLPHTCVLKMRNKSLQIAELIQATYPKALNLFVYRDAVGFVGSMYRIFRRVGARETITISQSREDLEDCYGLDADSYFGTSQARPRRSRLPST